MGMETKSPDNTGKQITPTEDFSVVAYLQVQFPNLKPHNITPEELGRVPDELALTHDFANASSLTSHDGITITPSDSPEFNPQTAALQAKLKALGYALEQGDDDFRNDGVDGYAGATTQAAISAFQANHGLEVTGVANKDTLDAINKEFKSLSPDDQDKAYVQREIAIATKPPEGLSRGERNNNPGNIKFSDKSGIQWKGELGKEAYGPHTTFETPEHGVQAMTELLTKYNAGGLKTVNEILNKYAPDSENNTNLYAKTVAEWMGKDISSDTELDLTNPHLMQKLVSAMVTYENGHDHSFSSTIINKGLQMAGLDVNTPESPALTP